MNMRRKITGFLHENAHLPLPGFLRVPWLCCSLSYRGHRSTRAFQCRFSCSLHNAQTPKPLLASPASIPISPYTHDTHRQRDRRNTRPHTLRDLKVFDSATHLLPIHAIILKPIIDPVRPLQLPPGGRSLALRAQHVVDAATERAGERGPEQVRVPGPCGGQRVRERQRRRRDAGEQAQVELCACPQVDKGAAGGGGCGEGEEGGEGYG